MPRTFSLLRRRPGLVDLTVPRSPGVVAYNFWAAANFDEAFTFFQTVPVGGFLDSNIFNYEYPDNRYKGVTRFFFDPNSYTDTVTINSTISIANALLADFVAHQADLVAHNVADTFNVVTAPAATNLTSLIALVNDLRTQYELHRIDDVAVNNVHTAVDAVNAIAAPPATDLSSAVFLTLDIQQKYNAHRILVGGGPVHNAPDNTNNTNVGLVVATTLTDLTPWWIRVAEVDATGAVGPLGAPQLLMPYTTLPNRAIVVEGTVPSASSVSNSIELVLPMQNNDWGITNIGANSLAVAFEPNGPEMIFASPMTQEYRRIYTKVSSIWVRGVGGDTTIRAQFTQFDNPNQ